MTHPASRNRRPAFTGYDLASGPDQTVQTMYIQHAGHPGCGFTLIFDDQIALHRHGLFPVRCKSCRELITDAEGA